MGAATMTVTESKGLRKGSRVYWRGDATDSVRITETSCSERDEIASEKKGFHMTIEGDLRHFHNQYIDDARST